MFQSVKNKTRQCRTLLAINLRAPLLLLRPPILPRPPHSLQDSSQLRYRPQLLHRAQTITLKPHLRTDYFTRKWPLLSPACRAALQAAMDPAQHYIVQEDKHMRKYLFSLNSFPSLTHLELTGNTSPYICIYTVQTIARELPR